MVSVESGALYSGTRIWWGGHHKLAYDKLATDTQGELAACVGAQAAGVAVSMGGAPVVSTGDGGDVHWTSCCDCLVLGRSTCTSDYCNLLIWPQNQANDRCRFISLNLKNIFGTVIYLIRDLELSCLVVSVEHYLCFCFWLDVQQIVYCRPYLVVVHSIFMSGHSSVEHLYPLCLHPYRWLDEGKASTPQSLTYTKPCTYQSGAPSSIHSSIKCWNNYFARLVTVLNTAHLSIDGALPTMVERLEAIGEISWRLERLSN